MNEIALFENSDDFALLYSASTSGAPSIARARINRDANVEDADENLVSVPAPSIALRDPSEQEYFSKEAYMRIYFDTMQTAVFDSDAEKYTNMSSHFKDFSKPALDWQGGDKCGWIPSKMKEKLRTSDPVAFASANKVKLYRHLFGTLRMEDPVSPGNDGPNEVKDVPFRMRLGPSNFMEVSSVLGGLLKQKVNPASVELKIDFELNKRGSNKWFTLKYKPIMTNIIELDSDYKILLDDFFDLVKYENEQVSEKMRENSNDIVDSFDDVLEA
jgi:hypothetical protein